MNTRPRGPRAQLAGLDSNPGSLAQEPCSNPRCYRVPSSWPAGPASPDSCPWLGPAREAKGRVCQTPSSPACGSTSGHSPAQVPLTLSSPGSQAPNTRWAAAGSSALANGGAGVVRQPQIPSSCSSESLKDVPKPTASPPALVFHFCGWLVLDSLMGMQSRTEACVQPSTRVQ